MRRVWHMGLIWCLLCGAAPIPATVDSPILRLGVPFRLTLESGPGETELVGIPPLGNFALLAPPIKEKGGVYLDLIPLRPGRQNLPEFSFHRGPTGHLRSAPLSVEVKDYIAVTETAAPLKQWPEKESGSAAHRFIWLLPLFLAASALVLPLVRKWKTKTVAPTPSLDELNGAELLDELSRRLETMDNGKDARWQAFSRRLNEARFAPGLPIELPDRLLADYRNLLERQ